MLVEEQRIEWRVHEEGEYRLMTPDAAGIVKSAMFPSLWIDVAALFRDDSKRLLAVLAEGLASPEHRRFAAGLESRTAVQ